MGLISTALVMLMIPALGFFEAGLIRSKNSLSILMQTFSGLAILTVLWFVIGFSLVYATSNGGFIGGFEWIFFNGVLFEEPLDYAPTIPGVSFAAYQMMFAVITPLLITGAFAERLTWNAFFVFIIAWSIFIYYPLAHWVWGKGWLADLGVVDFAGGIVIHTSAGMGAIAAALVLGRRKNFGQIDNGIPQYSTCSNWCGHVMVRLVWVQCRQCPLCRVTGWQHFVSITGRIGHVSYGLDCIDVEKQDREAKCHSGYYWCNCRIGRGNSSSGFISAQAAFFLGIVLGLASYYMVLLLKQRLKLDDALDVGSVHGITGIIGSLAIGLVASSLINPSGPNGLLYGNAAQLGIQALGVAVASGAWIWRNHNHYESN